MVSYSKLFIHLLLSYCPDYDCMSNYELCAVGYSEISVRSNYYIFNCLAFNFNFSAGLFVLVYGLWNINSFYRQMSIAIFRSIEITPSLSRNFLIRYSISSSLSSTSRNHSYDVHFACSYLRLYKMVLLSVFILRGATPTLMFNFFIF